MVTPKILFGAGGIGGTTTSFTNTWTTPESVSTLLDQLKGFGFNELDSAASYPPTNPWNTETLLGQSRAAEKGFLIDTKILWKQGKQCLTPRVIEESVVESLRLLGVPKVHILYAHGPDRMTPIEETAKAFDLQVRAGRCEKIGLCNWRTAEIAQYLEICDAQGYTKPAVIQSNYNALWRNAEETLFPLLRKHGIKFYAYSPLAGGFLTGKVSFSKDPSHASYKPLKARSHWEGESAMAMYNTSMDHPKLHETIRSTYQTCEEHSMTLAEASLRWLLHHSQLGEDDGIILGASNEAQIRDNMEMLRKGPLPEPVQKLIDGLHKSCESIMDAPDIFKFE